MAEARSEQQWAQTSVLAAGLHNVRVAFGGGKLASPDQFNPHAQKRIRAARRAEAAAVDTKRAFSGLRGMFCGR